MTPDSRYAVLWDLDGTIVDSALPHKLAWQETFAKRGRDFTEDDFKYSFGRRNEEIIPKLLGKDISWQELDAIGKEKEKTFRRFIKGTIKALPGVVELIESLHGAGFQLAVVSSTPIENILLITETLKIKTSFELLISGKDVTEGKPSPQGFLLAAKKLGVTPQNCVVMEDAVAGVRAAKSGGMHCIAITNTCTRESLSGADIIVDSLKEINVQTIEELFNRAR
ncbi:MAG: HAD family phosphatase [Dehalococcoidales bacterium]|nr:HAD family phosphatase [Dehalococcoidales bacterium]